MAIAREGMRPITVEAQRFYWRGGDYFSPVTVVSEDKTFVLEWPAASREPLYCFLRGTHPAVPERDGALPDGRYYLPERFALPQYATVTPAAVGDLVRWALDPNSEKRRYPFPVDPAPPEDPLHAEAKLFLRPKRPRSDEARRVLKQVLGKLPEDPVAALVAHGDTTAQRNAVSSVWEALAARDLLPRAWVEGRGPRVLTHYELAGAKPPRSIDDPRDAWVERTVPATLVALRCLAEDPEGVTRAEALAREFLSRISPWYVDNGYSNVRTLDAPLRWHCLESEYGPSWTWDEDPRALSEPEVPDERVGEYEAMTGYEFLALQVMQPGTYYEPQYFARARLPNTPLGLAFVHAHVLRDTWRARCEAGDRVPKSHMIAREIHGKRYSELRDPSEPLIELFRAGYALQTIDERGATLCAVLAPRDF